MMTVSLEDDIGISLAAITGINTEDTLRLSIRVAVVQLQALVDTGSTHTFIHEEVARRLGLLIEHRPGISVKVANGDRVTSPGVCKGTKIGIGKDTFTIDCFALPLDGFDIVLGVKWLKSLGPISFDFRALWMAFWRDGLPVCLYGIGSDSQPTITATATDNLMEVLLVGRQLAQRRHRQWIKKQENRRLVSFNYEEYFLLHR